MFMKFVKIFSFYLITASFLIAQSKPKKITKPPLKKLRTASSSGYRGANLGLLFGSILSFNEISSGGLGFGANAEYIFSKRFASSLVFSTGNLSSKDVTLSGTSNSTGKIVNIKQSSANTVGFFSFALGGRIYYPMGKFYPGFGVYFDVTRFRDQTYSFNSSLSVKFELVAWHNVIWKQLDIGLDLFYGLGSITEIRGSSDTYALSNSLNGRTISILLAARYRLLNL